LLDSPLAVEEVLPFALAGEAAATGTAPIDNVAPQLLGGLRLAHPAGGTPIAVPVPPGLLCVLVHPACSVETRESRAGLNDNVALSLHTEQAGLLAAFVSACYQGDLALLSRSLRDVLIEPQRASYIPGFVDVQGAALENSALGCSISGSGPSVFAWCKRADATTIAAAMQSAFARSGLESTAFVSAIDAPGARLLETHKNK
jgi:homoserine kinase